jgi:hypothetical protein
VRYTLFLSFVLASLAAALIVAAPVFADEFGSQDSGLRCYSGDLLADLRTKAKSGRLKDLPNDLKTLIANTDTLAILIDYKQKDKKMVVGSVKKDSSKVNEFKTYTPKDSEFDILLKEFPTFKD